LNASTEFNAPVEPNEDFQIKNLLKKPKKEQQVSVEQPAEETHTVENDVCDVVDENTDDIDGGQRDEEEEEEEDDNESVATECLDEREYDEISCDIVEQVGHQSLDLVRSKVHEISTETVSDEEQFDDELMAENNEEGEFKK
jgi:hypothetical protein